MNIKYLTVILASLMSLFSAHVLAARNAQVSDIRVVGLFKDAAVLTINHQRKLVRVGGVHQNVRLLAANSEKAMVEYQGRRIVLAMGSSAPIRTGFKSSGASAHLVSNGGVYSITGSINGRLTGFVVDTGATYITMSAKQARGLNLDFGNARKIMVNTANGKATAHVFTLKSIKVGSIEVNNVEAAVMHNLSTDKILLGMTFLNQVEMRHKNGLMVLKQRNYVSSKKKPKKAPSIAKEIASNSL